MPRTPVFLHSGFRSGSTWFWSRFRDCPDAYAYCEPFSVQHATLTPEAIAYNRPDSWASNHPTLRQPYFAEYEPLIRPGGGVEGFDPRFAVETYYKANADVEIQRYLTGLIDLARSRGKIPVFGFCRSLGRVAWFRRYLNGVHVTTWRNPRDQWCSSHAQWIENGNFHFEVHYLLVAYVGSLSPEVGALLRGLPSIPSPTEITPDMPLFHDRGGVTNRFRVFLRIFLLDMLLAIENSDVVVDLDLLSLSPPYRGEMTKRLRQETGLDGLWFEDCNLPQHRFSDDADYAALLLEEFEWIESLGQSPWAVTFEKSLPFVRARLLRLIAIENQKMAGS